MRAKPATQVKWFQGFWVSGFLVSWFLVSWFLVSWFQVSWFLVSGFRVSGFRVSGFHGFMVSWFHGFRVSGFRVSSKSGSGSVSVSGSSTRDPRHSTCGDRQGRFPEPSADALKRALKATLFGFRVSGFQGFRVSSKSGSGSVSVSLSIPPPRLSAGRKAGSTGFMIEVMGKLPTGRLKHAEIFFFIFFIFPLAPNTPPMLQ